MYIQCEKSTQQLAPRAFMPQIGIFKQERLKTFWDRELSVFLNKKEREIKEEVSECMKNEQLQGVKEVKKGIEVKKEIWYIYSYVHMKPLQSMFMKRNEVTLTGQNPPLKYC